MSMETETFAYVMDECIQKLKAAFQALAESFKELFGDIKEFVEQHVNNYLDDKPNWFAPKKIVMNSQVLNRKPILIRARSNC